MKTPHIAGTRPIIVDLKAGQDYWYCTCGKSANQPFCDGSHQGSDFTPLKFQVDEDQQGYLCMCKHSAREPFCDGSHKKLKPTSEAKPRIETKLF